LPKNNFDLIRLFAALQVVLVHGLIHFGYVGTDFGYGLRISDFFPGVPIFFFVSGFLITGSFERSSDIVQYGKNRLLRIYPALWVCFGVSLLLVYLSGYFETIAVAVSAPQLVVWIASQLSFLQFYNPDFMRGFGVGSLNGSLWAIPVELQFYVLVPLLVWLFKRSKPAYFSAFVLFAALNTYNSLMIIPMENPSVIAKLFQVTFLPWIAIFMLGQLAWLFQDKMRPLFANRLMVWLLGYTILLGAGLLFEDFTGVQISSNNISLVWMVPLCGLVLAVAFSYQNTSQKILGGTDISYGLYIFHMPIFNYVLSKVGEPSLASFLVANAVVVVVAILSWKFVERPALRFKTNTLFSR